MLICPWPYRGAVLVSCFSEISSEQLTLIQILTSERKTIRVQMCHRFDTPYNAV